MKPIKHLPLDQWPQTDHEAFLKVYALGDIFDDTAGPGVHLADGTRGHIEMVYRRWLGFLNNHHQAALLLPPADRITLHHIRGFIEELNVTNRTTSILAVIDKLHLGARLIAPSQDWSWLKNIVRGLEAHAIPNDRFERLVPPWQTFDLGIELMNSAVDLVRRDHRAREIQYRDGLIIALLSLWPIRRRSLSALTVGHHVEIDADGITLLLLAQDTKSKRPESFRLHEPLLSSMEVYLSEIRPRLLGQNHHDGLWASYRNRPLTSCQLYSIVRQRTAEHFAKSMCLHDFRRAAVTFLAMDAPDKVGLIPGVLQHTSADVSDQHYNLARSTMASKRHAATFANIRMKLAPKLKQKRN